LSVKAAIEADKTLGGAVNQAQVTQVSGYRKFGVDTSPVKYLGAEWTVVAIGTGT
jgi:hypothetical protein